MAVKKQVIVGLFIISSQILYIKSVNSIEQDILNCARVLQLSNELEVFLSLRQKVTQNPTEEGYMQLMESYNHFVKSVAVKSQTTDLHEAARNGNISAIYHLIRDQRMDVNIRGINGATPLSVASFTVMPLLFGLGADVNISDALGITSLHYVAFVDALPNAIYFLLDHGADMEAPDLLGLTPILYAIQSGNVKTFHALRSRGASLYVNTIAVPNALFANYVYSLVDYVQPNLNRSGILSSSQDSEDIQRRIRTTMTRLILNEEPSLLHTVDHIHQATALHWAGYYGDTESMTLFLERGLSPTEVNVNGEVPLHVAARSNQVEAFLILREANPSLMTATDNNGRTPEQTARAYDALDVLRVINQRPNLNFFIP